MIDTKDNTSRDSGQGQRHDNLAYRYRTLVLRRFWKHRLARVGIIVLSCLYTMAAFAPFLSPHDPRDPNNEFVYAPPMRVRLMHQGSVAPRPFVYGLTGERDPVTRRRVYTEDTSEMHPIELFVTGDPYTTFWGQTHRRRFVGTSTGHPLFLFGTDSLGRDLLSRSIHAGRVSLTIGLIGVMISFVLGCIIGGISGYAGGFVDVVIQRVVEFVLAIPTIPLWMTLSAALPREWSQLQVYFAITVILSLSSWTSTARVVRGKLIGLKSESFVTAAKIAGASHQRIILTHLLPNFASYLIVSLTLSIPAMIIGETSLSFLGLGLQNPVVSWGVLLGDAQRLTVIAHSPWLLIPGAFVVAAVLSFNFVGDGLRDAADPHQEERT